MTYDTPEKQECYRAPVWQTVDCLLRRPRRFRTVVILDTAQALETAHLLRLGYAPARVHVVNWTAQQVAWVKRRHPDVRTHAGQLWRVVDALVADGADLDVVSFDGMGIVGTLRMPRTISKVVPRLKDGVVLTVTLSAQMEWKSKRFIRRTAGRGLAGWRHALPDLSLQDCNRVDYVVALVNLAGMAVRALRVGRYVSRRMHMLWVVMLLRRGRQGAVRVL